MKSDIILERKTTEVFKIDLSKVKENKNPKFIEEALKVVFYGKSFEYVKEFLVYDFESNDEYNKDSIMNRFARCNSYKELAYVLIDSPEEGFAAPLKYLSGDLINEDFVNRNEADFIDFINEYYANKLDRSFEGLSVIDTYVDITDTYSDFRY